MKYRFRKTGEIVDVVSYSGMSSAAERSDFDYVCYIDSNGEEHNDKSENLNIYWDFESIDVGFEIGIDWEKRRYEIAKEAMTAIMCNEEFYNQVLDVGAEKDCRDIPQNISKAAVILADALIKQLKNKKQL